MPFHEIAFEKTRALNTDEDGTNISTGKIYLDQKICFWKLTLKADCYRYKVSRL